MPFFKYDRIGCLQSSYANGWYVLISRTLWVGWRNESTMILRWLPSQVEARHASASTGVFSMHRIYSMFKVVNYLHRVVRRSMYFVICSSFTEKSPMVYQAMSWESIRNVTFLAPIPCSNFNSWMATSYLSTLLVARNILGNVNNSFCRSWKFLCWPQILYCNSNYWPWLSMGIHDLSKLIRRWN